MDTLSCSQCHQVKTVSAFSPERRSQRGYRLECKDCRAAKEKARRAANPEPSRRSALASYYKHYDRKKAARKAKYAADPAGERQKVQIWRKEHPGRHAASSQRSRVKHRENIRSKRRQKYWDDPEQSRAEMRERNRNLTPEKKAERRGKKRASRAANPELYRAHQVRYRARKRQAPVNDLTARQWQVIKEHYGHRCVYCGRTMQRLTRDHIIPLSKGGSNTYTNVVPACHSCNCKKHTGPPPIPVQPLLVL